jgi:hypothetical protein
MVVRAYLIVATASRNAGKPPVTAVIQQGQRAPDPPSSCCFCYELRFPGGALSFPTLSTPNRDNPGPFLQIAGKVPTVKQIPGELQRIALTKGNVHGGDMSIFGGGLAVQNMACLKAGEEGDLKHIWWQVVIVDVPK